MTETRQQRRPDRRRSPCPELDAELSDEEVRQRLREQGHSEEEITRRIEAAYAGGWR